MRVAILADVPWPTGAAGSVRVGEWARHLAALGAVPAVVPLGHYGAQAPPEAVPDPRVALLREARYQSKYGILGAKGASSARAIARAVREFGPDWVLVYGRRLSTVAPCLVALPASTRIALDMVEHPMITLWERGLRSAPGWDHYLGARLALGRAQCVFAITGALGAACRAWTRAPVELVPAMVDVEEGAGAGERGASTRDARDAGARDAAARDAGAPILGYYGAWHAKDDPDYAVALLRRVAARAPEVRVETIGRVPERIAAALESAAPLRGRLVHRGFVDDAQIAPTIARWSGALLPRSDARSVAYAFPNRAAQLLAAGVPVVVRDAAGLAGYGEPDGVLEIPGRDADAGADALLAALRDAPRLAALRQAARRTAARDLSGREAVARALAALRRHDHDSAAATLAGR
ncbi:MAG: glycosyltransferase [Phycisphaerales bacterium]